MSRKVNGKPILFPKVKQDLFHLLQDKSVKQWPWALPQISILSLNTEKAEWGQKDELTLAPGVQGFQVLGVSGIRTTCMLSL